MMEAGLAVTVNSDDPAYFGGYLGANYQVLVDLGFDRHDLVAIAANSIESSFLDDDAKQALLAEIEST
jgi:adenosine deaminase